MQVEVDLPNHPYHIKIEEGCFSEAGDWVSHLWQKQMITIITDSNVEILYGESLVNQLKKQGFTVHVFSFAAGEASKTLEVANRIYAFLAKHHMTRSDGIIALGGGVVGDLAAFVASTYMRGIHFLQIPTSLTAQVDSSIGGKTGVNTSFAKNMVGTFAQPDGVLIDPVTLKTLGNRELVEGMGEVIKYGLIDDIKLWHILEEMDGTIDSILDNALAIIYHSCQVKRKHVLADQYDKGLRMHLNFGHTIGHAIEVHAGYGEIMHGEAIAIGMIQLSRVAERKNLMPRGISQDIYNMCLKFGLPVHYAEWDKDVLFDILSHDKKASGQFIKIVILPQLGSATVHQIPLEEMRDYLEK